MSERMVTVEWRCKGAHKGCEGRDWRFYKQMTVGAAKDFMEQQSPNSRHFEYRIKP